MSASIDPPPEQPVGIKEDEFLDEIGANNNLPEEEEPLTPVEKFQNDWPHLYFISVEMILPLFILIGMAFFFGWLLALAEMPGEVQANDDALRANFRLYLRYATERQAIHSSAGTVAQQCMIKSNLTLTPKTLATVRQCAKEEIQGKFPQQRLNLYLATRVPPGAISFHWMNCNEFENLDLSPYNVSTSEAYLAKYLPRFPGLNAESSHDAQFFVYLNNFGSDFMQKAAEAGITNVPGYLANKNATQLIPYVDQASGGNACKVHTAGGAMFWFTIMTTIGYGNTAPVTTGGRALVFTAGFITIIGFLALNNTAATVVRVVVEDFFLRCNLHFLVEGPLSCLFWMCMTILWMLVLAVSLQSYKNNRFGGADEADFPLGDAYWFSYVTTTTVGFGDIFLEHEEFQAGDMFFIPLLVLLGFNILGIFAEKMIDLYTRYFPKQNSFEAILQQKRQRAKGQGNGKRITWV